MSASKDTHFYALVYWKSTKEVWIFDPQIRGDSRCIRSSPAPIILAANAYESKKKKSYGRNWKVYKLFGDQVDTPDCGQRVIDFIKTFPLNISKYNSEKEFIPSFNRNV
jgi:hypothetical protein